MQRHLADTDEGQAGRVDGKVLVVGASGDHDGVAGGGRADRGLDAAIAAVADEQEVAAEAVADILDAGERVGALAAAGRHDEMAEAIVRDHRGSDRSGVGRGVGSAAADEAVAAAAAAENVGDVVADDGVVAGAAGRVLDVDQHVGADVDAFRLAHQRVRVERGRREKVADCAPTACRFAEAVDGIEVDGDGVRRRRVADGVAAGAAVVDVVAAALAADDGIVAAAGIDNVVAASGMDRVRAGAGHDEVGAVAGSDMGAAGAGERDRGRHVVRNREVEILVGIDRDVDRAGGRRREYDGIAGLAGGQDRVVQGGEAVVAGAVGIDQQIAAAAELNVFDAMQRVGAEGTAIHLPLIEAEVEGDGGLRQRPRVSGRVIARTAGERVGAKAAGENVGADIAGERIVAAAAGDVLDAGDGRDVRHERGAEIDGQIADGAGVVERVAAGTAVDHVGTVADDVLERVVAAAAVERVDAEAAGDDVIAAVAGDDVGKLVAGAVDVGAAGQRQVLDIGAERVADRRLHRVGAAAHGGGFRHHVAGIVDHVDVVAVAAQERVGACAAIERVVAGVAGDDVGEPVAGAVDVGAAGQGQVLDIGAERVGDRGGNSISARVQRFRRHVAGVVDDVVVVADAADHDVGAAGAVERVVATIAGENVDAGIAGQRIVADAAGDVLDPGHGGKAGRAGRAEIDRHRAGGAGIVERIDAAAAVDCDVLHIGRGHALDRGDDAGAVDRDMDGVVAPGSRHREGVGVRAAVDRVDAVADGVLDQVVAGAAVDGVVAEPAGEGVVAAVAIDDVGQPIAGDVDVAGVEQRDVVDAGAEHQRKPGRAGGRGHGQVVRRSGRGAGIGARADMDGVAVMGGIDRPLQARRGGPASHEETIRREIDVTDLEHDRAVAGIVHGIQDVVGQRQKLVVGRAGQQHRVEAVGAARRHIGRGQALVDDMGLAGAVEHVVGDRDGPGGHVAAGANAEPDRVVGEGVAVEVEAEERARRVGADAGTPAADRGIGIDDVREGVARHVDVGVVREQEAVIGEPIDRVVRDGAVDAAEVEAGEAGRAGKHVAADADLRAGGAVPVARDKHRVQTAAR